MPSKMGYENMSERRRSWSDSSCAHSEAFVVDCWNITDYLILAINTGIICDIHAPVWSDITRYPTIHYRPSDLNWAWPREVAWDR